ncbi:hypothetical protein [Oricola thermophila]|uniref:DUF4376 domain-containing protein n=1 Tax=Oricola thermophila TaxID=2742145 RepID=A0A6N1VI91_9HYPH|nr:hypothetical protein [Oricola thermophila]QKV18707.1 hypothetical protein HTY61_09725 [Oricola thermophila]
MIDSATYTESGTIIAVIDGKQVSVPDDPANRHRRMISEWEAGGGVIEPYQPPAPTAADVNSERDRRIAAGTTLTVAGYGSIPITGTLRDQIALEALRSRAVKLADDGVTEPVMLLRDRDNVTHNLTPAQMVELVDAGMAWIEATMRVSWAMKDATAPFEAGIPADYADDQYWP